MLWTIFATTPGENWVVSNRELLEKVVDRFFSYFDTYATGDGEPSREMQRLENAFKAVFAGSNIDQQAGLRLESGGIVGTSLLSCCWQHAPETSHNRN